MRRRGACRGIVSTSGTAILVVPLHGREARATRTPARKRSQCDCRGFTLFEVILALAIAGMAMGIISQIIWSGMNNARMTENLVQAELLAESVMAEVMAGVRPMESADEESFDDESGLEDLEKWVYSIQITPIGDEEELTEIRVTVHEDTDKAGATSFSLSRWILTPEDVEAEE